MVMVVVGYWCALFSAARVTFWSRESNTNTLTHVRTANKINATYLVRLRFWRASRLLSTSGGRLLETVEGEWTRKARPELGLEGLPVASDKVGDAADTDAGCEGDNGGDEGASAMTVNCNKRKLSEG